MARSLDPVGGRTPPAYVCAQGLPPTDVHSHPGGQHRRKPAPDLPNAARRLAKGSRAWFHVAPALPGRSVGGHANDAGNPTRLHAGSWQRSSLRLPAPFTLSGAGRRADAEHDVLLRRTREYLPRDFRSS